MIDIFIDSIDESTMFGKKLIKLSETHSDICSPAVVENIPSKYLDLFNNLFEVLSLSLIHI